MRVFLQLILLSMLNYTLSPSIDPAADLFCKIAINDLAPETINTFYQAGFEPSNSQIVTIDESVFFHTDRFKFNIKESRNLVFYQAVCSAGVGDRFIWRGEDLEEKYWSVFVIYRHQVGGVIELADATYSLTPVKGPYHLLKKYNYSQAEFPAP